MGTRRATRDRASSAQGLPRQVEARAGPRSALARIALACLALLLAACASARRGPDPDAPYLTPYGTYAWAEAAIGDGVSPNVLPQLQGKVDDELAAMGLRRTTADDARLLVGPTIVVELETVFSDPYYAAFYTAKRYENGVLTIAFEESGNGEVVWQGTSRLRLRTEARGYGVSALKWVQSSEQREWKLDQMVAAILDRLPRSAPAPSQPGE